MKVLVSGGKGQLASCIEREWESARQEELILASSSDLDFYDVDSLSDYLSSNQITHLVHTSAYTAVDLAEDEPDLARKVNVNQTRSVAEACARSSVFMIHISTDFVYGGPGETPRKIEDASPESVYGLTKLDSEKAVLESGVSHLIIRTSWLYSSIGRNFYLTMNRLLGEGKALRVVNDQHGTPTSAFSLARFIIEFIRSKDGFGLGTKTTMNFSNEGSTTWYGFALAIREMNGLPGTVAPCTSEEYPQKAKRPTYSVMDLSVLCGTGWENVTWEEALREVAGK
ncbi:SDR family oxidoreductase [Phaeocystidibacter luteus]|uniref:dTDP-4-dehydrorhamnose reductase n=1 Tax=Phaeocystidibacter luteus TaxID=911197 RepID=A0A6N6RLB6_9FLAO|nr:sugar nucleotide-binding protein [Phaeocystidibacter luteus]KAB2814309.1 sugar nucleotide-binding protein [Phaeocystidibacter luteus]